MHVILPAGTTPTLAHVAQPQRHFPEFNDAGAGRRATSADAISDRDAGEFDTSADSNRDAGAVTNESVHDKSDFRPVGNSATDFPTTDEASGTSDTSGSSRLIWLDRGISGKIERCNRDGRDPHDLFDPSKPDYLGIAEALRPCQKAQFAQFVPPLLFFARPPIQLRKPHG